MATNTDILNKAISHLGESGTNTWKAYNTNGTNWGTGWAWCCAFVWRVFKECGASSLFYGGGKTASVGVADDWFYRHCEWVKYDNMRAGDIVIFTWYPTGAGNSRSGREKSHIGIIERRVNSTQFYAIEGNTGSPSAVRRRLRTRNYVYAIYRPKYAATPKPTTSTKLAVDGVWGKATSLAFQRYLGVTADGIFGKNSIKAMQRWLGVTADGLMGPITRKKLQAKLGVKQDGVIGPATVKALQTFLNKVV